MLTPIELKFTRVYIFILILEIICSSTPSLYPLHYITKPALLISLLLFFISTNQRLSTSTKRLTILALSFSLLGDILLMFTNNSQMFFTLGLVAFLFAHLMYILIFIKDRRSFKKGVFFLTICLLYALLFIHFLQPHLGSLLTPVIIYIIAILSMVTTAFLRHKKNNPQAYYFILTGAILFMISDSILAINKFIAPIPFESIGIMLPYGLAQLLLVLGIKKAL
ncbi:lysoplasmalogenase [Formosa haliotis]|uniref:lysoplasmalogenase n=1 Tax=Formosa haliotis TaxID=1555194 RepID=UPI000825BC57|nr:lysoplasmalogenase [Formosa haliotis]